VRHEAPVARRLPALESQLVGRSVDIEAVRSELHALVDYIPEGDAPAVRKMLRALVDPVRLALLNAPLDDEPMSEHERAAWEADEIRRKKGEPAISHEEILRDLGLG